MQRMFCHEYIKDFNGTRAAREAGSKCPAVYATGQLKKPLVSAYLGKLLQERMWRSDISADRVVEELVAIAMFDPAEMFDEDGTLLPLPDMPPHVRRALAGCDVEVRTTTDEEGNTITQTAIAKIKSNPKLPALELLAKHLGMKGIANDKLTLEHKTCLTNILPSLLEQMQSQDDGVVDDTVIDSHVVES